MTGFQSSLLMTIAMLGSDEWSVNWSPDLKNVVLQIVVSCPNFLSTSRYTIAPEDHHAVTHRAHGPVGSYCQVVAAVFRAELGDLDPDHEWIGDSTSITVIE